MACFCLAQNSIYPSSHLPPGSHCSTSYFHSSSPSNFLLSSLLPNICLAQDSICLTSYSRFNFSLFPIFTKAKENLTFWFWGKCLWVDAWIYWTILSSLIFNSLHIYSSLLNLNIHLCRGVGGERDLAGKDLRRHLARLHAAHQPMERSQVCHC